MAVELDVVGAHLGKQPESGVARADVVEGQPEPQVAQLPDLVDDPVHPVAGVLGELDDDLVRAQPGSLNLLLQRLRDAGAVVEDVGGGVDEQQRTGREPGHAGQDRRSVLRVELVDAPEAERGGEGIRRPRQPVLRSGARQPLVAEDASRAQVPDGLERRTHPPGPEQGAEARDR